MLRISPVFTQETSALAYISLQNYIFGQNIYIKLKCFMCITTHNTKNKHVYKYFGI